MLQHVLVELIHPAVPLLGRFDALMRRREHAVRERVVRQRRAGTRRHDVVHGTDARERQRTRRRLVLAGRTRQTEADDLRGASLSVVAEIDTVPERQKNLAVTRDEGAHLRVLPVALLAWLGDALRRVAVNDGQFEGALGARDEVPELGARGIGFEVLFVQRTRQRQRHEQARAQLSCDARHEPVAPLRERREHNHRSVGVPGLRVADRRADEILERRHVLAAEIAMARHADDERQRTE